VRAARRRRRLAIGRATGRADDWERWERSERGKHVDAAREHDPPGSRQAALATNGGARRAFGLRAAQRAVHVCLHAERGRASPFIMVHHTRTPSFAPPTSSEPGKSRRSSRGSGQPRASCCSGSPASASAAVLWFASAHGSHADVSPRPAHRNQPWAHPCRAIQISTISRYRVRLARSDTLPR